MALVITGAVFAALLLLFTKLRSVLERASDRAACISTAGLIALFGVGFWLGFIHLDGATYPAADITNGPSSGFSAFLSRYWYWRSRSPLFSTARRIFRRAIPPDRGKPGHSTPAESTLGDTAR